jgi:hypothetical protein
MLAGDALIDILLHAFSLAWQDVTNESRENRRQALRSLMGSGV